MGAPASDKYPAIRACDILKVLRAKWVTRDELADEIGSNAPTCGYWLKAYETQGVAVSRLRGHVRGRSATEYTLAPAWRNDELKG